MEVDVHLVSQLAEQLLLRPPYIPPSDELVKEAVQLLKSLRPSVKALCMRSVHPTDGAGRAGRALLDGGATHILRPAVSKVELAAGVTTLGQVESTGTLITDFDTQTIVPLGKVVRLGYKVKWEGDSFALWDQSGGRVKVVLESGCPIQLTSSWPTD